jgi:hypothetical protein
MPLESELSREPAFRFDLLESKRPAPQEPATGRAIALAPDQLPS